jgi:hypothetical protein
MRSILLVLICLLDVASIAAKEKAPTQYAIPLPPKPDYSALEWLIGDWAGRTTGRSAAGEVRFSAAFDLDKQFMVLRGEVSLAATKTAPAAGESWMGILSASRAEAGFVLWTFSSTGFIARYRVTVEGAEIRINPEGGEQPPPGWLFRTLIQRTAPEEFTETVQAAPPAKSFFDYYSAKLTRLVRQDKPGSAP